MQVYARTCRLLQKTLNVLDDLVLCSEDKDKMTFVGRIIYLWPLLRSGTNDTPLVTNKLFTLQRSCNCPIVREKRVRHKTTFCICFAKTCTVF